MKRVYILVEGPTEAAFLRRILPPEALKDAELVIAGGSSGIPSLARSVLVRRKSPIAVVIDADSVDPDVVAERQQSTEELIRAADASIPIKVVSAVPEIEAWLFATPETIERILGQNLSADWLSLGKRDPRGVLQQLAENNKKKWDMDQAISTLNAQDIERIRAISEVAELSTFLQQMQSDDQAA
jgi:hypothetical protein